MSQSRFSIVLVGVSALLRRPLVSRLRPADGERSSWVVFTARVGRFDSGGRSAGWPSGSLLPLFGMRRFGVATGRVRSSAFRFGVATQRVGLRAHGFRFSARTASGLPSASWFFCLPLRRLPLGGLAFGLTASAFRHAPLRGCRSAGWPSGSRLPLFGTHRFGVAAGRVGSAAFRFGVAARRVGLRAHCFRFSACTDSEWPLGEFVLPPSVSEMAARRVGLRAHDFRFRHAPLRGCPRRVGASARRVGLRAHCFRFSACTDPHRRAADARTDGAQRHDTCFTSKHLSQHVNLPHRTP